MPLLEQQQFFGAHLFYVYRLAGGERMTVWQREFKEVLKQRPRLEVPAVFIRKGEQHDVERPRTQLFDEARRQVFDKLKLEGRIDATQLGQNLR